MTTTLKEILETETCGRCGGSGHYSYNQIDGTRCYGCGGTGTRYTKRGQKALEYWRWLLTTSGSYACEGDRIFRSGGPFGGGGWMTIESISETGDLHCIGKGGRKTCLRHWTGELRFSDRGLTACMLKATAAYQASLTKAGTLRKR